MSNISYAISPERKNKTTIITTPNIDWKNSPFNEYYCNLLINYNISYVDKHKLLTDIDVDWNLRVKGNIDILSLTLINEVSAWQKRVQKIIIEPTVNYNEKLDDLCCYIVTQMIKNDINPENVFNINNLSHNNIDLVLYFGLEKTFEAFFKSKFRKNTFINEMKNKELVYFRPSETGSYKAELSKINSFLSIIENNFINIVDLLLSNGFPVNFENEKQENALFYVTSDKMVKILIKHGITNENIKNSEDKNAKEFVLQRWRKLNLNESILNKTIGVINSHIEIDKDKFVELLSLSFFNDKITNFKNLLNKYEKYTNIKTNYTIDGYDSRLGDVQKTFNNVDLLQKIFLDLWDKSKKMEVYGVEKFSSKILLILKTMHNKNPDYFKEKVFDNINMLDFIILTISGKIGVLTPAYFSGAKAEEENKAAIKLIEFINEKTGKDFKFLKNKVKEDKNITDKINILKMYNECYFAFKGLHVNFSIISPVLNETMDLLKDINKMEKAQEDVLTELLLKMMLSESGDTYTNANYQLNNEYSFEIRFIKKWELAIKKIDNLKNSNILEATVIEARNWIFNNREEAFKNKTIKEFVNYIKKDIVNDEELKVYLQPFIMQGLKEDMMGQVSKTDKPVKRRL